MIGLHNFGRSAFDFKIVFGREIRGQ